MHISIHHFFGSSTLNLTRAAAAAAAPEDEPVPSPVPSAEAGDSEDKVDADVGKTTGPVGGGGFAGFVHAGLCSLAFLLVIPSGALVVRYAKATGSAAAFDLHRYLQFGVGMCRVFASCRPLTTWLCCTVLPVHHFVFVSVIVTRGVGCRLDLFPLRLYSWHVHCRGHARVPFHGYRRLW